MNTFDRQVLEELVYERVKLTVDLYELLAFEKDLDDSIQRAVERLGGPDSLEGELSRRLIDNAWQRLTRDLDALREGHDLDCTLCRVDEAEQARWEATAANAARPRRKGERPTG